MYIQTNFYFNDMQVEELEFLALCQANAGNITIYNIDNDFMAVDPNYIHPLSAMLLPYTKVESEIGNIIMDETRIYLEKNR